MPKTDLPPLPAFDGWDVPRYTPIPDQLFDEWLPHLSEAELKVLLYIMRRTFGFKKNADAISLRQMSEGIVTRDGRRLDWGAGVGESSVLRATKSLVEKGLIERHQQRAPDGDYDATVYRLRMQSPTIVEVPIHQIGGTPSPTMEGPVPPNLGTQESVVQKTEDKRDVADGSLVENTAPPPYSPVIAGAVLDLAQALHDELAGPGAVQVALRLWQRSGWSEAAFVAALQAARGKQRRLSGVLGALAKEVPPE